MRILGVDPGSRATGWAVVDFTAAPRLLSAGVLRPPGTFLERLEALFEGLSDIVARERPDVAAVERIFAGVNSRSLIALGEARGVLLLALARGRVPVVEITPAEIKRAVAGSGVAEKEQVRSMVYALLRHRLALDASDAAAAALAHGFVAARRGAFLVPPDAGAGPAAQRSAIRRRPAG